jgi:uncharacterized damage-inducible protein DinB
MRTLLICLLASSAVASAQDNPLSAFNKRSYGVVKSWLLASAEKMPAESYTFKPTDTVRSFGQIIGHAADAQYYFCSPVLGEKGPADSVEKTKTSKAELIPALKDAFAFCDKAYDTVDDTTGLQRVKLFGGELTKISALSANVTHNAEHYGNLVTYLRIKNIVPPSSDTPPPAAQTKK